MSRFFSINRKRFLIVYLTALLKLREARQRGLIKRPRKRFALALGLFLTGISFAGVLSTLMSAPQIKTDYLHEHLKELSADTPFIWTRTEFDLPDQDKLKIGQLITQADQDLLKEQARNQAHGIRCVSGQKNCVFPLRLSRRLTAEHLNQDFRVVNVKETSLRLNLQNLTEGDDFRLKDMAEETRILRFYQSQAGWIQNNLESVEVQPERDFARHEKFKEAFSQRITGMNYYPATASWRDFWVDFPLNEITSDLAVMQDLNVNAIRIFLNHEYFEQAETQQDALDKLKVFLDLCENYNIQVLVTLFDLRPNYELSNWTADINHIKTVLSSIASHAAILAVDLKNQADLDFENWGEGRVEAWLTVMARHIHKTYPDLAVTIGWSSSEHALRLKDVVDVITYHEYQSPKGFEDRLRAIKAAAQGKPVMITELGSTIWHPPFIKKFTEKSQASRLAKQLNQAGPSNGVFVWTLNDFDYVGAEVVGPLPWRQAQQRHFGLRRPDGSLRPSANVLKKFGAKTQPIRVSSEITSHNTTHNSTF